MNAIASPGPALLALAAAVLLAACQQGGTAAPGAAASPSQPAAAGEPTAAPPASAARCPKGATPAQTEGPYFKAGSPERTSLVEPGMSGTRLTLTGRVLTADCRPVAGAVLDFWQADASGVYDNSGFRLRGHQATDAQGRYTLETVIPGQYPGRTEHIHVKVRPPGGQVLTTQLYFPGVARNQQDSIFDPALLVDLRTNGAGATATFDFVLPSTAT